MIPKVKDPLVLELEKIVTTQLGMKCSFMHVNMFEANFGLDRLKDIDFPVFVFIAGGKNRNKINVASDIIRRAEMTGFLLTQRADLKTTDYKSSDLNDDVYQMYQLGQNLMNRINASTYSRSSDDGDYCGVTEWQSDEVYAKGDAHLFGQDITFTWTVNTGVNGYQRKFGELT